MSSDFMLAWVTACLSVLWTTELCFSFGLIIRAFTLTAISALCLDSVRGLLWWRVRGLSLCHQKPLCWETFEKKVEQFGLQIEWIVSDVIFFFSCMKWPPNPELLRLVDTTVCSSFPTAKEPYNLRVWPFGMYDCIASSIVLKYSQLSNITSSRSQCQGSHLVWKWSACVLYGCTEPKDVLFSSNTV